MKNFIIQVVRHWTTKDPTFTLPAEYDSEAEGRERFKILCQQEQEPKENNSRGSLVKVEIKLWHTADDAEYELLERCERPIKAPERPPTRIVHVPTEKTPLGGKGNVPSRTDKLGPKKPRSF